MGQNKLNNLSILCIENEIFNALSPNDIIHQFVKEKPEK